VASPSTTESVGQILCRMLTDPEAVDLLDAMNTGARCSCVVRVRCGAPLSVAPCSAGSAFALLQHVGALA